MSTKQENLPRFSVFLSFLIIYRTTAKVQCSELTQAHMHTHTHTLMKFPLSCLFVFTMCPHSSFIHCVKSMWEESASLQFSSPSWLYLWVYCTCFSLHPFMHVSKLMSISSPEKVRWVDKVLKTSKEEEEKESFNYFVFFFLRLKSWPLHITHLQIVESHQV